jgi:hypothetical protein
MRTLKLAAAFALALLPQTCMSNGAETQVAMVKPPQVAIFVPGVSKLPPTNLVVIACRVDDLTGQPGRHGVGPDGKFDETSAARDWRDLEPAIKGGELECKREVSALEDAAVVMDSTGKLAKPLNANFGNMGQCVHAGAMWSKQWNDAHRGWAVFAIGCPVPIVDQRGVIKAWKMPDCPRKIGGMEGIKCKFDESVI